MSVEKITDSNFTSILSSEKEKYILVDFWAEWCGPCKMLGPVLEAIEIDNSSKLRVMKLNTDENPESAQAFGITSIPCCILFKDSKEVHRIIGYMSKSAFEVEIRKFI